LADSSSEPVVIIGLGRFGSNVALELDQRGTEVLAIDRNPKTVQSLAGQLPHVVSGDSTDPDVLEQLSVGEFQRAVVAIGSDIQASILTTSLLSDLGIQNIWAKAVNQQHARILSRVGAHHVVFPEHEMGERVAHLLSGRLLDYVEVDADFAVIKMKPPRETVGIPLGQSRVRTKWGVTVVAVKPQNPGTNRPPGFTYTTPETGLTYGDISLVVGSIEKVERFAGVD